ncbi:hypothetical protein QBC47DRAFT_339872 [Echria macrotheca]|uniref:AB hydrolase-1 domain-containing protein n=1 Tax=Echria macrotheca TaxID=438768 RepID=A0AAJ0F7W6_9PEZI|nr:hypothetical protein QBC47DRAFT_339872 [Echria macrotheca]
MASVLIALVVAALSIKKGKAAPSPPSPRSCVQLEIPVSVDTVTTKWLQPRVDSSIDAVDWMSYMTTWTSPKGDAAILGNITVKQTFKINGQLCVPPKGAKSDILQLATHGVGFDKRYWDAEVKPQEYSYVEAVLAQGYSIFTYDRLGTGGSDKPDAYDILQTNVQVEILRGLTTLARSGKLVSSSKKLGGTSDDHVLKYKPKKIVHVGHSLGSVITLGLVGAYGAESDGAIATGFLYTNKLSTVNVATWGFQFARENDPVNFKDRGSGYVVQGTKYNTQLQFLKKGAFEPALLDYAFKIRQPNSVSEFVSIGGSFSGGEATNFKAPIQFVIGEHDYGFCAGDCNGTYNITMIKGLYPAATAVDVHIQPKTGHGLTLSTNATAGYKVSFDFLEKAGL